MGPAVTFFQVSGARSPGCPRGLLGGGGGGPLGGGDPLGGRGCGGFVGGGLGHRGVRVWLVALGESEGDVIRISTNSAVVRGVDFDWRAGADSGVARDQQDADFD